MHLCCRPVRSQTEHVVERLVACRIDIVRRLARSGVISPALAEAEVRRMRAGQWKPLERMTDHARRR